MNRMTRLPIVTAAFALWLVGASTHLHAQQASEAQIQKALQLLRQTPDPSQTNRNDAPIADPPTEGAIEFALQEADKEYQNTQTSQTDHLAPRSQESLNQDLQRVEEEILKAKQEAANPPSASVSVLNRQVRPTNASADNEPSARDQRSSSPAPADRPVTIVLDEPETKPPPSASSPKPSSLDKLLRAYRSNEITAAQYHKERARLLQNK